MITTFNQDIDAVSEMAKKIFDMENVSVDSSMKSVLLNKLVEHYVELHYPIIKQHYDFISVNQSKKHASYGDCDITCTMMKVTNGKGRYEELYDYTFEGMLINDIFCSNKFIIVKENAKHKTHHFLNETTYHIRKVDYDKKFKSIAFDKYVNCSMNYKIISFDVKIELGRYTSRDINGILGMLSKYKHFYDFFFSLKQIITELNYHLSGK